MDCAEAKLQIEPYVAGELPADQKEPLEAHLAGCPECRLDSELTRASRNPPTRTGATAYERAPDPNAAPADFVEPIQPEPPAPADSSAPAAVQAGSSWTLEGIFGAGTDAHVEPHPDPAGSTPPLPPPPFRVPAGEPPVAASLEPEPERDMPLPEVLHRPVPITRDEPPPSDAPSWDFEPADVKGAAKPPEKSLFFAEEALSRPSGAKRKSSGARVVLWSVAALLGLGLLAFSVWIAMTVQDPPPSGMDAGERLMRAGSGPEIPAEQQPAAPSQTDAADGADGASAPAPSPVYTPQEIAPPLTAPPVVEEAPRAAATTPAPPKQEPPAPPRALTPVKTPATSRASATPRTTPTVAKAPAPARSRPAPRPEVGTASRESSGAAEAGSARDPVQRPPSPQTTATAPPTSTTSPQAVAPSPAPSSSAGAESAAGSPSSGEAVQRPIDRLHLATLTAEQNADLAALRKLREAWRGFVKTSVGPDRARAKRELADCLWAVQTLTARESDQKEALAAYRDYVLNAPAGGADSRTVARMRQLEDAVAESR